MTAYAAIRYVEGGEPAVDYAQIPAHISRLWDVNGDRWDRLDGLWVAVGETDPVVVDDPGLLDEFGPVTDEEKEVDCGR